MKKNCAIIAFPIATKIVHASFGDDFHSFFYFSNPVQPFLIHSFRRMMCTLFMFVIQFRIVNENASRSHKILNFKINKQNHTHLTTHNNFSQSTTIDYLLFGFSNCNEAISNNPATPQSKWAFNVAICNKIIGGTCRTVKKMMRILSHLIYWLI